MKRVLLIIAAIGWGLASYAQSITVTSNGGSPTSYTSFFDACAAITAGTHPGDVEMRINGSFTETQTCTLRAVPAGGGGPAFTSLNIIPTGAVSNVDFAFNGKGLVIISSNNVSINGIPNLISSLSFSNSVVGSTVAVISIQASSNISIRNLGISTQPTGRRTAGCFGIELTGQVNRAISLRRNRISNFRNGIMVSGVIDPNLDCEFVGNQISDFGFSGIWSMGYMNRCRIDSNVIYHTTPHNEDGVGIRMASVDTVFLSENWIYGMQYSGTSNTVAQQAMSLSARANGFIGVYNNIIKLDAPDRSVLQGINIVGGTLAYSSEVVNNTVHISGTDASTGTGVRSYGYSLQNTSARSHSFINNIIYNDRTGSSGSHVGLLKTSGATLTADYNHYQVASGVFAQWNGSAISGFASYQSTAAPAEVNSRNHSFTLTGAQLVITSSQPRSDFEVPRHPSVAADYRGRSRSNPTLPGAVEDFILGLNKGLSVKPLRLSPNPARQQVSLSAEGLNSEQSAQILVHDLQGKAVYRASVSGSRLDLPSLPAGLYQVRVSQEGRAWQSPLVVE